MSRDTWSLIEISFQRTWKTLNTLQNGISREIHSFSEADEKAMLLRFFTHIQMVRPAIYVTYNGDSFDWPYIETRAKILGIDMKEQCELKPILPGRYSSSNASHMDCYRWVKRDSYLPAGSQGLKAVTSAKLGYDPLELDPEEMTDLWTDPQTL